MYKFIICATVGIFLGYLVEDSLYFAKDLVRLSFILLFLSFAYAIGFSKDVFLKSFVSVMYIFLFFFILGNLRMHIIKEDKIDLQSNLKNKNYNLDKKYIIREIVLKVKDIRQSGTGRVLIGHSFNPDDYKNEEWELSDEELDIAVYTKSEVSLLPGDIVKVLGEIKESVIILPKREDTRSVFKSFDLVSSLPSRVNGVMLYPKLEKIGVDAMDFSDKILRAADFFRESVYDKLNSSMDGENAGVVFAMTLGDDSKISQETKLYFRSSGMSHILVLSGYNLVVLIVFIEFFFKAFSFKLRIGISAAILASFLLLADTSSPVFRAAIMVFYLLLVRYSLKPEDSKMAIWVSGALFCLFVPETVVRDVGLHMSFLATLGIVYFYPLIQEAFEIEEGFGKIRYKLICVVIFTIAANILIAPYILYKFGEFNAAGLLGSVIVTFLIPLIMMLGLVTAVVGAISQPAAQVFGFLNDGMVDVLLYTARTISKFTPISFGSISGLELMFLYFAMHLGYLFFIFCLKIRKSREG